jgi:hypothetical protein
MIDGMKEERGLGKWKEEEEEESSSAIINRICRAYQFKDMR